MGTMRSENRRRRLPSAPVSLIHNDNISGNQNSQSTSEKSRPASEVIKSSTSEFHKPQETSSRLTQEILNQIIAAEQLPLTHGVVPIGDVKTVKKSGSKQRVELVEDSFKCVSSIKEDSDGDPFFITRTVEINKTPKQSLGFFIREGNGIDCKEGIFVSRVTVGCYVNVNGLLRAGDEITSINGVELQGFGLSDVVAMIQIPRRLVLMIRARAVIPTRKASLESSYPELMLADPSQERRVDRGDSVRSRSQSVMNVQSFRAMRANSTVGRGTRRRPVTITPAENVKVIYDDVDGSNSKAKSSENNSAQAEVNRISDNTSAVNDWVDQTNLNSFDLKQESDRTSPKTRRRLLPTPPITPSSTPPKRRSDGEISVGSLSDTLRENMLLLENGKTQKLSRKLPITPSLNNERDMSLSESQSSEMKSDSDQANVQNTEVKKQETSIRRYESQYIKNMLLQQQQKHSMFMHSYSSGQLLQQTQQSEDAKGSSTKTNFAADWKTQIQNKFSSDQGKKSRRTSVSSCETCSQTSELSNPPSDPEIVSQVDLSDLNLNVTQKPLPSHAVSGMVSLTIVNGSEFNLPGKRIMEKKRKMYCTINVDNQRKACTNSKRGNKSFAWDEQFEIELQHSRQLNIQCFLVNGDFDKLLAEGTVTFSHLLKIGRVHELPINLNPKGILVVRIEFTEMKKLLERTPSDSKRGVFGFNLEVTSRVEHCPVPLIVRKCIKEIDRRGLDILGIYRICGNARKKKELRAEFDWDSSLVDVSEEKYPDINVITGVLKDYLRQLPEPLIAHEAYELIIKAMENRTIIETASSKRTFIADFLDVLPNSNRETTAALLDHLRNVLANAKVNKMNAQNLAVCLGPVLLCPAPTSNNMNVLLDFKTQIRSVQFLLEIWPSKEDREKDDSCENLETGQVDDITEKNLDDERGADESFGETTESVSTDDFYNSSDDDYV